MSALNLLSDMALIGAQVTLVKDAKFNPGHYRRVILKIGDDSKEVITRLFDQLDALPRDYIEEVTLELQSERPTEQVTTKLDAVIPFPYVKILNAIKWCDFMSFDKFPAVERLAINLKHKLYPDVPTLRYLVTQMDEHLVYLPPNWTSIAILKSSAIPHDRYHKLHIFMTAGHDLRISTKIAQQLEYLKIEGMIANQINLLRYRRLKMAVFSNLTAASRSIVVTSTDKFRLTLAPNNQACITKRK